MKLERRRGEVWLVDSVKKKSPDHDVKNTRNEGLFTRIGDRTLALNMARVKGGVEENVKAKRVAAVPKEV
jgi:hypothetical protein